MHGTFGCSLADLVCQDHHGPVAVPSAQDFNSQSDTTFTETLIHFSPQGCDEFSPSTLNGAHMAGCAVQNAPRQVRPNIIHALGHGGVVREGRDTGSLGSVIEIEVRKRLPLRLLPAPGACATRMAGESPWSLLALSGPLCKEYSAPTPLVDGASAKRSSPIA